MTRVSRGSMPEHQPSPNGNTRGDAATHAPRGSAAPPAQDARQAQMSFPAPALNQRVSAVLSEVIRTMPAEGLTLQGLLDRLGDRGLLILCMVLTMPFLLPVSIPGSSIPFGVLIALIAVGLVTHRAPWLPARLMNRRLARGHVVPMLEKGARLFARLERLIHPRLWPLTHGATVGRFNGILLGLTGLLMMAPLPLPLSNTLPAYGVLFLARGVWSMTAMSCWRAISWCS